ncbi:DNA repair ATPase, partial [Pseudomonas aeruginosa]|uniref:DNA repair ATPase n=1 Tax=Pseudomonas aeruginosa TaxID=287 RepID=UPI003CC56911
FCTEEYEDRHPARSGFLGRIGNAELVGGVSDLYDLCREIESPAVSIQRYSLLCQNTPRLFDVYHSHGTHQQDGLAPGFPDV